MNVRIKFYGYTSNNYQDISFKATNMLEMFKSGLKPWAASEFPFLDAIQYILTVCETSSKPECERSLTDGTTKVLTVKKKTYHKTPVFRMEFGSTASKHQNKGS